MVLEIEIYGSKKLREKAIEVEKVDDSILELLDNMVATMKKIKGIGLAAPQVGINKRIFVIDIDDGITRKIINPKLEYLKKLVSNEEGCLSVPGVFKNVDRFERVKATYLNEKSEMITEEVEGVLARAFQHEYDHLEGILFVDKISPVAKRLINKKLQLLAKEGQK